MNVYVVVEVQPYGEFAHGFFAQRQHAEAYAEVFTESIAGDVMRGDVQVQEHVIHESIPEKTPCYGSGPYGLFAAHAGMEAP